MTPAPAFDCASCGHTIGRRGGHNVLDAEQVVCSRCLLDRTRHAHLYPDCPTDWHDLADHATGVASTRAAVASVLGLWPQPKERTNP